MKRIVIILFALSPYLLFSQSPIKKKKYPSLLWEISGNGLSKPSYLFGTMHVSSKVAFHLADSFYMGILKAEVVALETNPESWQEDMSKFDLGDDNGYKGFYGRFSTQYNATPDDYLRISSLRFGKYDKRIERMLYSNSSTINNLLYRTYGNEASDFEEDTYLDLYIYQCGKKWGKKIAGVEKYGESMKLMMEAYQDAAKDKNKKQVSYENDNNFSNGRMQEAYRSGNLDWLDSINRYNSYSAAFDEKFLYKRNEIQANSIDSILRSGKSLFAGVGAAHLPGDRGVIEMLRSKGYRLRPVKMGERDSNHKNQVEKLKVPVLFTTQTADDGMYQVDIPGKFYKFGDEPSVKQNQYADMANGSYYMVTRVMTNAWMWGHNSDKVYRITDSLLYENIPGKMISKTAITRNGYKGFDITSRTRRGDIQRYNIFITPFEVIVFKMSGTGEYVRAGEEAKKFFSSIRFKEYQPQPNAVWKKYSPSYGGFSISLPHEPFTDKYHTSFVYDAEETATNTQYRIIRTDIHNYRFAEEDTFDLNLIEESFASSDFIGKLVSRKHTRQAGYPALDCRYEGKNGDLYLTKFVINGPHYYTLVTHGKKETTGMKNFLQSFEIKPFIYGPAKEQKDTVLYYTVKAPLFAVEEKEKLDISSFNLYGGYEDDETAEDLLSDMTYKSKLIENDSTGEKIFVSFFKSPRYAYEDSTQLNKENELSVFGDTSWIVKHKTRYELQNKTKVFEAIVTDTGSSRSLWTKTFYKEGIGYNLMTQTDTLTAPSTFLRSFFDSFTPSDTLKGSNIFTKKTNLFFDDFLSTDSLAHRRAVRGIDQLTFDSTDLPRLKQAVSFINWNEKKYLETKKSLITRLNEMNSKPSSDYLKELYYAAGDTVELQYTVLRTLLSQQTQYAYSIFREIISNEPPVIGFDKASTNNWQYPNVVTSPLLPGFGNDDEGDFMGELYDSLQLTKTILPDLLPLLNLDDYKYYVMQLLGQMTDSSLIKTKDYEQYFTKFLLEAKQELRKQAIAEKQRSIKKAEQSKSKDQNISDMYGYRNEEEDGDSGNEDLGLYAKLLLPFWDSKPNIKQVIDQMLSSSDKRLKYNTLMLLIRNSRPYADTMLGYFASMDDYRYELYSDLRDMEKAKLFPKQYNNHLALAKSKLLQQRSYDKPDSLIYIDRLATEVKNKKGFVYFFKYKDKKDDVAWKLASAGLLPADSTQFEFIEPEADNGFRVSGQRDFRFFSFSDYKTDFTKFSNAKLTIDDVPVTVQLKKELKKMIYSKRKSAREFYDGRNEFNYGLAVPDMYEEGQEE